MPTPTRGPRLGGSAAHQRLILGNLATELFRHERITTTEAKAKRLRPFAERIVTFARRGDLHARRRVMRIVGDKEVVHKLFEDIGPRYVARPGGYTRIIKIGPRKGDNAQMAMIELVEPLTVAQQAVGEADRARRVTAAEESSPAPAAAEVAEPEAGAEEGESAEDAASEDAATTDGEESETAENADEADGSDEEPKS